LTQTRRRGKSRQNKKTTSVEEKPLENKKKHWPRNSNAKDAVGGITHALKSGKTVVKGAGAWVLQRRKLAAWFKRKGEKGERN